MVRDAVRQESTPATAANEQSSFRQGGKRPRTTPSIFAAAANGMLTGLVAPTAVATAPSFAEQQCPDRHEQQLFSLRGHMGAGRVSVSATSDNTVVSANDRVVPGDTAVANAVAVITTTAMFRPNAADAMILDESSYREDALGEAAAMAADERRSSPPAPPPECSVSCHRNKGRRGQASSPHPNLIDDNPKGAWSQADPFGSRTQKNGGDCVIENRAMASGRRFIDAHHRGSSSPTAPAYEPSPLNEDNARTDVSWRYDPERHLEESVRNSQQEAQRQRHRSAGSRATGDDFQQAMTNVLSSRATNSPSQGREVETNIRVEIEGNSRRHTESPQERVPVMSNPEGKQGPPPTVNRQNFLSTTKKSNDAHQSIREDLLHYMEGVRARWADPCFREILLLAREWKYTPRVL